MNRRLLTLALATLTPLAAADDKAAFQARTRVSIEKGFWNLNGKPTYPGTFAEGLLLNARFANAGFDDVNPKTRPKGFDPEKNTTAFLEALPDYRAHGLRAVTVSVQGVDPGYAGAKSPALAPDGKLHAPTFARLGRLIEGADRLGVVVILTVLDAHQDQILRDATAVKQAVSATASWIKERGYKNILLEVASAHDLAAGGPSKAYDHEIVKDPKGCASLIALAHKACPGLLVSASGSRKGRVAAPVISASDFVLLNFSTLPAAGTTRAVMAASKVSKPIVCNRDVKVGPAGAEALEGCFNELASWGYGNPKLYEHYPFQYQGAKDDPAVYGKMKELTAK